MNDVAIVHPEEEVRLVLNVHLAADGFNQAEGRLLRVGVADDGLALVDGQKALHGHGDGASVVHFRMQE